MKTLTLSPEAKERLAKLTGMFGSDYDGERAAAALKATRLLADVGATWADLVASLPVKASQPVASIHGLARSPMGTSPAPFTLLRKWQKTAQMVAAYPELLNDRELDFARDMAVRRDEPTPKQMMWLNNLAARVQSRMAA